MNEFLSALQELRKTSAKRNFEQSVDLIINLKDFDIKRETINTSAVLPYLSIRKKVCAFLENISKEADYVITKKEYL